MKITLNVQKLEQHVAVLGFLSCCSIETSRTFLLNLLDLLNRSNIKTDVEKGGSFAAYYRGQLVTNLWGGYSDYDCRRLWKEDTLSTFFSSTKAVASSVIAHLVDRFVLQGGSLVIIFYGSP